MGHCFLGFEIWAVFQSKTLPNPTNTCDKAWNISRQPGLTVPTGRFDHSSESGRATRPSECGNEMSSGCQIMKLTVHLRYEAAGAPTRPPTKTCQVRDVIAGVLLKVLVIDPGSILG
ncbi:hypothetical protein J1614_002594 [Plenodomus biglobosus]|nr:hypothetical protein J1614_002594 [Plenodomus biglobosus]